jgi:MFS transporter, ACS family, tartrate transporter
MSRSDLERTTMRRVYWHFVPILFASMLFNYLDRFNIGYAALRMNLDLGLTPAAFGFGASIFFVGYMLLEVPSNMMLDRFGARRWISRILISWGLVAVAMAFVTGAFGFFSLRFLLGVAEAGLLPGLALFTTSWFPIQYRARAIGGYVVAGQLASIIAGPVSTAIMTYCNGLLSLHGWQWMFVVEGGPTIILGLIAMRVLTDQPADASWLEPERKEWIILKLKTERDGHIANEPVSVLKVLFDSHVWSLAALFGCALVGIDSLHFWQPQIIKDFGKLSDVEVGLLSAIPAILSAFGTVFVSITSDWTGDRKLHLGGLYIMGAFGLAISAIAANPVAAYSFLCLACLGLNSGNSLFWSLNSSLTPGANAAISIALVNTLAQTGGLIGPWMIGLIRSEGGSFSMTLMSMSAFVFLAGVIALSLRIKPPPAVLTHMNAGPSPL